MPQLDGYEVARRLRRQPGLEDGAGGADRLGSAGGPPQVRGGGLRSPPGQAGGLRRTHEALAQMEASTTRATARAPGSGSSSSTRPTAPTTRARPRARPPTAASRRLREASTATSCTTTPIPNTGVAWPGVRVRGGQRAVLAAAAGDRQCPRQPGDGHGRAGMTRSVRHQPRVRNWVWGLILVTVLTVGSYIAYTKELPFSGSGYTLNATFENAATLRSILPGADRGGQRRRGDVGGRRGGRGEGHVHRRRGGAPDP